MAAKKKNDKNKPGPWDDIARGVSGAAGAVKRTVYSNPGNKNKASNLDKWLKGGSYQERPFSDLVGKVAKGAKVAGKVAAKGNPMIMAGEAISAAEKKVRVAVKGKKAYGDPAPKKRGGSTPSRKK